MSTPEQVAQQKILLRYGALPDLRIWRQNTGQAWQPLTPGARDAFARLRASMPGGFRPVMYGTKGAADVQGILGPRGRFVAVEVKSDRGRLSEDQERWGAMIRSQGGIWVMAKTEDDVGRALDEAREG